MSSAAFQRIRCSQSEAGSSVVYVTGCRACMIGSASAGAGDVGGMASTMAVARANTLVVYDDERQRASRTDAAHRPYSPAAHRRSAIRISVSFRQIEKVPSGAILGLDDPRVGIEGSPVNRRPTARHRLRRRRHEQPFDRTAVVIDRAARGTTRVAVHQRHLDEDGAGLGALLADCAEHARSGSGAISRDPNAGANACADL